jgi:hypothetical protein
MQTDEIMRMLGLGGDPAAGRPGVNVSQPGQRNLPGAGPVTTGRAYNPQVGSNPTIPIPVPRPSNIGIHTQSGILPTMLAAQPGAPEQGAEGAVPAETAPQGAGRPTTGRLLDQLGAGAARPYLQSFAAGMQAPGSPSGLGGFASGFSGAIGAGAARDAATAKQAREDAKDAREMAMEERKLTSEEKRAEASDRRAQAEGARSERRLGMEEADFKERERRRTSGEAAYEDAENAVAKAVKSEIGERQDWTGEPDDYDKKFNEIKDEHLRKRKLATGSGSWDRPFVPGYKYQENDNIANTKALEKEGQYARIRDKNDGKIYLNKSARNPATGQIQWFKVDEAAEKQAMDAAAAEAEAAKSGGFLSGLASKVGL